VAEGARLESVYTFTGIGGSNPSLSASFLRRGDSASRPISREGLALISFELDQTCPRRGISSLRYPPFFSSLLQSIV
jgi:hypothetical protein